MTEEEKNTGVDTEQEQKEVEAPELTFDEMLALDKKYQAEFDRRVAKANETSINKAKKKWEEEAESKKAEAIKLAEMDEIQKANYETEKYKKLYEEQKKNNEISSLKAETLKQASDRGIPLEMLTHIRYEYETADSIAKILDDYESVTKNISSKAISEYSKEPSPQTTGKAPQKDISQMTYAELCELPEYKNN